MIFRQLHGGRKEKTKGIFLKGEREEGRRAFTDGGAAQYHWYYW